MFATSTQCAPEFMWVTISDRNLFEVYAVDASSQKLTPRLGVLSGVPAGQTAKLGSDAESFSRRIREEFCRAPNGRL